MKAILHMLDNVQLEAAVQITEEKDFFRLFLTGDIPYEKVDFIDFAVELAGVRAGEEGCLVLSRGSKGLGDDCLCYFREREDMEAVIEGPQMPIYGMVSPGRSFLAVVEGMTYDYELVVKVEKGTYFVFPRFRLGGVYPYEDIQVYLKMLPVGADYNDVAHAYREYRRARGEIIPLKERKKGQEALQKAIRSPFIRIRMGWKPVPTPVHEQTPETEPPMKTACTFEDVKALARECRRQGIKDAEFCLVGFNIRGHDGRWPQVFPVEPDLGGEEKLKELIEEVQALGYSIVCHTNSTDAYSIADCWDEEDIIRQRDGSLSKNETSWSGGDMYNLCPHAALRQARETLPRVEALGFRGLHYIDVISTVSPRACYSGKHPATARKCVEIWLTIMKLSRELFGGFSSEGGFDFAAPYLDYGLYVSFGDKGSPLCDKKIPLWQLVYHGYVMGNPYTTTVNPDEEDWLKVVEYGGRPAIYFYSQFVTPDGNRGNWMGTTDYACHTREEREESVEKIAAVCRAYEELAYLQEEFMETHEEMAPGVFRIAYSDGSVLTVDYGQKTYQLKKA